MTIQVVFFDLGDTLITKDKKWISGAKNTLEQLHQQGMRLGLISNTGTLTRAEFLQLLPPDFPLAYFEDKLIILSSEVQLEKPDPKIFKLALARTNVGAGASLFCTEELLHILVAQKAGLWTVRLQAPPLSEIGNLVALLTKVGFLPA